MVQLKDFPLMTISEVQSYTIDQLQNFTLEELRNTAIYKTNQLKDSKLRSYFLDFIAKVTTALAADLAKDFLLDLIDFLQSFD